jgi:hypothetical protein
MRRSNKMDLGVDYAEGGIISSEESGQPGHKDSELSQNKSFDNFEQSKYKTANESFMYNVN